MHKIFPAFVYVSSCRRKKHTSHTHTHIYSNIYCRVCMCTYIHFLVLVIHSNKILRAHFILAYLNKQMYSVNNANKLFSGIFCLKYEILSLGYGIDFYVHKSKGVEVHLQYIGLNSNLLAEKALFFILIPVSFWLMCSVCVAVWLWMWLVILLWANQAYIRDWDKETLDFPDLCWHDRNWFTATEASWWWLWCIFLSPLVAPAFLLLKWLPDYFIWNNFVLK